MGTLRIDLLTRKIKFQYENKLKRKIRTIEAQERRNVQRKRQKLFHEYQ